MRFLILGAGGMAGHTISIYLKEKGHDVTGFARRKLGFVSTIVGDVTDTDRLKNIVISGGYDAVINCIGILNQKAETNKAEAILLNGYLPHYLADITADIETQIIQMSTDCVFSGMAGGYTEKSFMDGETFYDRSKAIGELEDNKNLTLRNSIIGPDINENGIGLLNWFMKQKDEVNGYTHAMWTGLTTLQLAKTMEAAVAVKAHGLINMVNKENISKYELLKLFNHYLKNDEITIIPYEEFVIDKTLVRTNFEFDYIIPDYKTMVEEMSDWMKKHSELYPHYKLGNKSD